MTTYKIKVNGKTYEVKVVSIEESEPTPVTHVPATAPAPSAVKEAPAAKAGEGTPVESPMQGVILDVKVKAGDAVKSGQTLLILEAMKLENEIKAPKAGTISSILVSKGQQVNSKQVLLTIA
jgi:biotin carboxyl carrier protein